MRTLDVGERFLEALLSRDFAAMETRLDPRVRLRALQPSGAVVRAGARPVVNRWAEWLGGWDALTIVDREASQVASRLRLAYHLDVTADADHREVAHQLLVDVVGGRIVAIDLLCSGFLEVPRRPDGDL